MNLIHNTNNAPDCFNKAAHAARAVTFDVFDTAITRCWAKPAHLFIACAQRLRDAGLWTETDEAWMQLRSHVEAALYTRQPLSEPGLASIYTALTQQTSWNHQQQEQAMKIELTLELESCRPVIETLLFWRELQQQGIPTLFLSDMYLPTSTVHAMLQRSGFDVPIAAVWVSAEKGISKWRGDIFKEASCKLGVAPSETVHIGDHRVSDFNHAIASGFMAIHFDILAIDDMNRRLLDDANSSLMLRSIVVGAMRCGKHSRPMSPDRRTMALQKCGLQYAGPFLSLYVLWLLNDASARGLRSLYFLARDGQVLFDIARSLQRCGAADPALELYYIHGSRKAWFAPSVTEWSADILKRILDEPDEQPVNLDRLARRLGFANAAEMTLAWSVSPTAFAACQNADDIALCLVEQVPRNVAMAHFTGLRQIFLAYLRTQGLDAARQDWAIVDLGWRGRLQEALARCLQAEVTQDSNSQGYYLALLESPQWPAGSHRTFSLFAEPDTRTSRLPGPPHIIDLLCEADHGSTQGYRLDEHGVATATFSPAADPAIMAWGLAAYRDGITRFAEEFSSAAALLDLQSLPRHDYAELAMQIGRELFSRPSLEVASVLAEIPYSASSDHDDPRPLAQPVRGVDAWLWALSLARLKGPSLNQSYWRHGSVARSASGKPYRAYLHLKRLTDRVKRKLTSLRR